MQFLSSIFGAAMGGMNGGAGGQFPVTVRFAGQTVSSIDTPGMCRNGREATLLAISDALICNITLCRAKLRRD